MKISIIGNNLSSLVLAKALINKNIDVQIFYQKTHSNLKSNRTVAITNKNMTLLKENLINIPKNQINFVDEISIYTENNKNIEILNFKNKKNIFFLIKNQNLLNNIRKSIKKIKFTKIKNKNFYENLMNEKKNLIINCEKNNLYNKKFFSKKFYKDYQSQAFTLIMKHESIKNNKATQIFTKFGPLAFLPLSKTKTSIVFSVNKKGKAEYTKKNIINLVRNYNKIYNIVSFSKIEKIDLKFEAARNYYYKNILLFGDSLHQIHPLAGQGFNMTLRDLDILIKEIAYIKSLGLQFDRNLFRIFENKARPNNIIYTNGINFLENFFKIDTIFKNKLSNKIPLVVNNNKKMKNLFMKIADQGLDFFSY